jgi:uncharacterized protein (DUF433 family)
MMNAPELETVDLSKYIEMRDGRANIKGRRLPVSFIASAQKVRQLSIADIAYEFTISEEQVLAALLYYHEHEAEIDEQDAAETVAFEAMRQQYGRKPGQR